jgi:FAD-linked oxidoreductase
MPRTWRNWVGTVEARPGRTLQPTSVHEVQSIVSTTGTAKVRMAGSGHSFTPLVPTDDILLLPHDFGADVEVDTQNAVARVPAGMLLSEVNLRLAHAGFALANMGDITAQTIAGAIATSTHGTGRAFTGLAGQVHAFEMVLASGELLRCSETEHTDVFRNGRVSLGALGVMTHVEVRVVPSFRLHAVEEPQPVERVLEQFDAITESNDHFEFYWVPHTRWALTKMNRRTTEPPQPRSAIRRWCSKTLLENYAFGAVCALGRRFPSQIPRLATALPGSGRQEFTEESFRVFATRRLVRFHEMEYSIPLRHLPTALRNIMAMVHREGLRVSFPVEVRTTGADDVSLSTSYGRESAYIAVHMYRGMPYEQYFRSVEEIVAPLDGRPHWGKIHYQDSSTLRGRYPRFDDFLSIRERLDPQHRFTNAHLERVLGAV